VAERLARDTRAGLESRRLLVGRLEGGLARRTPVSNLWVLDDEVVVYQDVTAAGPPVWVVSARQADADRASRLWEQLWERAGREEQAGWLELADPVVASAEQFAAIAPISCRRSDSGQPKCSWYHGVWQYLRLFDMVASPSWHADFYFPQLRGFFKASAAEPRVLITGAADYAMLAYILAAAAAEGAQPRVSVLDLCPTPLTACQWYARQLGHEVEAHEMDLLHAVQRLPAGGYDLITTDAFLSRLPAEDSRRAVEVWFQLLRPGGIVVTTVRLHPEDRPREDAVMDEVSDFARRARAHAERWRWFLRARPDDITEDARQYALWMHSTDLGGADQVSRMFTDAGFTLLTRDQRPAPGELRRTAYLRITAQKPTPGNHEPSDPHENASSCPANLTPPNRVPPAGQIS
jgi:SAM-dependent methyltransferase